jgi:hypothetical protein
VTCYFYENISFGRVYGVRWAAAGFSRRSVPLDDMKRIRPRFLSLICICVLAVSCSSLPADHQKTETITLVLADRYYDQAVEALDQKDVHRALRLLLTSLERDPHHEKAQKSFERITGNLHAEAVYTHEEVKLDRGLSKPLHYFLVYREDGQQYPVKGMPVRFRFLHGEGSLTGYDITDDAGIARCYVDRVDRFGDSLIIRGAAVVETEKEERVLDAAGVSFIFGSVSPLDREQRVIVHLDWLGNAQRYDYLRQELRAVFEQQGFTRIGFDYVDDGYLFRRALQGDRGILSALSGSGEPASMLLVGVEQIAHSQDSPDFHRAVMRVSVQYLVAETPLFRERFEQRGAGSTETEAGDQAFAGAIEQLADILDTYLDLYRRTYGV